MRNATRMSQRLSVIPRQPDERLGGRVEACVVDIAVSAEERRQAAGLVAQMYRAEGYLPRSEDAATEFYGLHHLLDEAVVFIARKGDRVVGTLTVVTDSPAGLPLETLYGTEVTDLRRRGRKLCELCSLAVDPDMRRAGSAVILRLFRAAFLYLYHLTPVEDVLITLKPSHRDFYTRWIGFEPFGPHRLDSRFADASTVCMRLRREYVGEAIAGSRTDARFARIFHSGNQADMAEEIALRRGQLRRSKRDAYEIVESIERCPEAATETESHQLAYLVRTLNGKLAGVRRKQPALAGHRS